MPDRRLRLAFFGTPQIAQTVLNGLIAANTDDIALVVSQPDRPTGRGKKLEATPVKALAVQHGLPVAQPKKLRDGALAAQLRELEIDLAIVVAYGRILPVDVFEAPRHHTWNVHASLLPLLRGASPIQHAILEGHAETGVTLMQLSEGMDEGHMLLKRSLRIEPQDTGGRLTERLAELGAAAAVGGLALAKTEGLSVEPQPHEQATYAGMLQKKDGHLDFSASTDEIDRRVRALDPWPGTFVLNHQGQPLKIRRVARVSKTVETSAKPGCIVSIDPLWIRTGDGIIAIEDVQPPGKRSMSSSDFIRGAGRHLKVGNDLSEC
ncbi:MAG: methionyl-tRNA formyltransferase [Myxococcota bacterium]